MPTACFSLYILMNYISRACTAFSGGGFCFSCCFVFGFWSGPVPGSQLLKPLDTSKALWSPEPLPIGISTMDYKPAGERKQIDLIFESLYIFFQRTCSIYTCVYVSGLSKCCIVIHILPLMF